MVRGPTARGFKDRQSHLTLFGEFKRVRKEILEHLLQTLGVCDQALVQRGVGECFEREAAVFRLVTERPGDHFEQAREKDLFRLYGNGAGFDLRQIKDVAD